MTQNGRSYIIRLEDESQLRRNRRFLKPVIDPHSEEWPAPIDGEEDEGEDEPDQVRVVHQEEPPKELIPTRVHVVQLARPVEPFVLKNKEDFELHRLRCEHWIKHPECRIIKPRFITLGKLLENGIKRIEAAARRQSGLQPDDHQRRILGVPSGGTSPADSHGRGKTTCVCPVERT